jgi:hypothetical protein
MYWNTRRKSLNKLEDAYGKFQIAIAAGAISKASVDFGT